MNICADATYSRAFIICTFQSFALSLNHTDILNAKDAGEEVFRQQSRLYIFGLAARTVSDMGCCEERMLYYL